LLVLPKKARQHTWTPPSAQMDSLSRLLDTCSRCLSRYENVVAGRPLLAAVSGGVDSTVLALLLARLQQDGRLPGELHFAHVDHAVRADSRANAEHVVALGERLGVPVRVRRLELAPGRRAEDELLTGRYRALAAMAQEVGAGAMLTAHHADDNLETVLFRLLRGTGPRGLAGIPESRWLVEHGRRCLLVRPFLRVRRATLALLLAQLGERAFEDSTNLDLGYARNRLRLETIPRLRQDLGVGLDVALMTLASTARGLSEILEAQGARILAERTRRRLSWCLLLDLEGLGPAAEPFVEEALRLAHSQLHPRGERPLSAWTQRAVALLRQPDGTRLRGRGGLWAERTRQGLLLLDPERAGAPPRTDDGGQLFVWDSGRQRFGATEWCLEAIEHPQPPLVPSPGEAGRFRALLDPRTTPLPWRLRTRRPGDRFQPLGLPQPIVVGRFLLSRHVPRFDRDRLPLLVDANDAILWLPGVEVAEPAKVLLNTRRTIEVRASIA
jgi:tRNA(Ile)-lysidine synthase